MDSNFTALRLNVMPNDISCCMWDISKKDSFTGFILETLCLNAWRSDPDSASKYTEILQIVFLSGRKMDGGGTLTITRKCIPNTQDVKESEWPICNQKTSTNQTTFDTVRDSTMGSFFRTILQRRISTSRIDCIIVTCEEIPDTRIAV